MTTSAVPGDHHTTTATLSAERWTEIRSLDLLALMDDTSAPIVSRALADLIAEVERLRATLAEEERACAERGKYLAEVDAALIAAGQDEAGGYIAYPRRVQQLAGEARFWHFEYREAMDNYKDEAAHSRKLRAELDNRIAAIAQVRQTCALLYADRDEEADPYRRGQDAMADVILEQLDTHARALAASATCTCGAALVHQHGCPAGQ